MAEEVGSICVFNQNSLAFKPRPYLIPNSNDIESLVINIISQKSKNAVISAHYRQPAGDF